MNSIEDKVVVLWNDKSTASLNLARSLRDKGYSVKEIFSGASKPVAQYGNNFYTNYSQIYSFL